MKFKWKLSILGCVVFILFVSFKILEPSMKNGSKELHVADPLPGKQLKGGNSDEIDKTEEEQAIRDAVIDNLIKKYKLNFNLSLTESPWKIAANWVKDREIIPAAVPQLGAVLKSMSKSKIIKADFGYRGSQLKLKLVLEGDQIVAFKPKWYSRSHVIEGKPYDGADRHNGEIAAFHLGRILDFRRTPLIVGRTVDLHKDIMPVATSRLLETFFTNGSNTCFYGKCYYCKGKEDGVCADGSILEGAIVLWLPKTYTLKNYKHPWSHTYRPGKLAVWETDGHFCDKVIKMEMYKNNARLMDLIDVSVFDYLIGNADRHHYETLGTSQESMMLLLDNAKSFGNPYVDEKTILAPLYQCCRIRYSTWHNLLILQNGILSTVLKSTLSQDPIAPVLDDLYYVAIDRRLKSILSHVETCIKSKSIQNVLVTDR